MGSLAVQIVAYTPGDESDIGISAVLLVGSFRNASTDVNHMFVDRQEAVPGG
jgi:hypothetical protein